MNLIILSSLLYYLIDAAGAYYNTERKQNLNDENINKN